MTRAQMAALLLGSVFLVVGILGAERPRWVDRRRHIAQGLNGGQRRVKNDEHDAIDLADMLRLGRLPKAWIAPPATRKLRELVRYRAKLVALRSGLKAQVHAVMAKEGVLPTVADMFGGKGNARLDGMAMAHSYRTRVASRRGLVG